MGYERNEGRSGPYRGSDRDHRETYGRGDRGYRGQDRDRDSRSYGRPPQSYGNDDRGFFDRAGDEVRSWFGDEDAERRRRLDERDDDRDSGWARRDRGQASYGRESGGRDRTDRGYDPHYQSWRDRQMSDLDRDYHEYRQENQSRFESEFGAWRQNRQAQRGSLAQVQEHQEVVGSDGQHVGTVDKVRGDRILLTKTDQDAGGHHHSIPSSWLKAVGEKVEISKTADQAKQHWRDEERNAGGGWTGDGDRGHVLNRSFSGTY